MKRLNFDKYGKAIIFLNFEEYSYILCPTRKGHDRIQFSNIMPVECTPKSIIFSLILKFYEFYIHNIIVVYSYTILFWTFYTISTLLFRELWTTCPTIDITTSIALEATWVSPECELATPTNGHTQPFWWLCFFATLPRLLK